MTALALSDLRSGGALRLRFERLIAQPAIKRTLPWIAVAVGIVVLVAVVLSLRGRDWTAVYPGLAEADKSAVAEALRVAAFDVSIDTDTGAVRVPADRVAAARILLAGQGLPKAAPSGAAMLEAMPLGTSRAVEGAQLKAAQEHDLAASIELIDAVEHAQVHLAAPEPSVFIRDHAAPSASVLVTLARGRTLSDAQVRAVVHLIASGVAGLDPERVSVVDQTGTLLTTEAGGELGESGRMLDVEARTAATVRQRIVALLTPILGRDNFSAQVTADLDFAENAATRESYDKGALTSEQGSNTTETPPPPARGIPGALSNTVPQAAQVSMTPPAALPAPAAPGPQGSSTFARNFEVGKAVSVTRAVPGQLRRLSVAVVVRSDALGAAKGQAGQLASLTALVKGAVGFDGRRGDVVTVAGRAFVDADATGETAWWRPVASQAAQGMLLLAGFAMLVFGIGRPWLRSRIAPAVPALDIEEAPQLLDYTGKLSEARALVGSDTARAAAVIRGMMRA